MHDRDFEDLIQLDLDGEATPAQRAALADQLERSPEKRQMQAAMKTLHQIIDERSRVDLPEDFRSQIATRIDRASRLRQPSSTHSAPPTGSRSRFVRFGLALAAVLALAVVLAPPLMRNLDTDQLRGTMAPPAEAPPSTNRIPLAAGDIRGTIVTESEGRKLIIRTEIERRDTGHLDVTYDPDRLHLVSSGGASAPVESTAGHLAMDFGSEAPELRFERVADGPLSLKLHIDTDESGSGSLELLFPAATNFSNPELYLSTNNPNQTSVEPPTQHNARGGNQ